MFAAPILVSEATALRDGLQAAIDAGYQCLHIGSDNQIVIQAVLGNICIPWRIQMFIHDIQAMLSKCSIVCVRHVYREGNMAAIGWLNWEYCLKIL